MYDNTLVHTVAVVRDFLKQHVIESFAWLSYSPNLNPIEYVWNAMKDHIYSIYGNLKGRM